MSDVSRGPSWQLASDGGWYPPERHPSERAVPPAAAPRPPLADHAAGGRGVAAPVASAAIDAAERPPSMLLPTVADDGWAGGSLRVVGSPVAAHGVVVVIDVTSSHRLELSAVSPVDGSVLRSRPFSASEITPGVGFGPTVLAPTVLGATVLALAPAKGPPDPRVTVEGVNVTTGEVTGRPTGP